MKTTYKFLPALGALAILGACNDLDTAPMGNVITSDQKEQVIANDPSMTKASVNALPMMTKQLVAITGNTDYQTDFGWASSMLYMDVRTADMPSTTSGYNWYAPGQDYSDKPATSVVTRYMWSTNYNMIYSCNSVLKSIDPETTDPMSQYFIAQAKSFRAWAYFNLAQMYQFTYAGNQDKPCVPVITELNSDQAATDGAPRETVERVYEQILSDLNTSIEFLKATGNIAASSRDEKQFFTASSATGLRARVYLVMNKWKEAAEDAKYVIDNSGCKPYSIAEVSKPSFWNAADNSWLLAIDIESGQVGNLHCWPAHMVSFYIGGYAGAGVIRYINKALYDWIPDSDVRKGWWCNANGTSPNLDSNHQMVLYSLFETTKDAAYANVKFDTYQSMYDGVCYLNDIPLMRIEEMYYTYAEATAMAGGDGASILNAFVKAYRNTRYNFTATSKEEVQEECWMQRRIELWGEGLAYYDLQRLKKPVDRVGGGYEPSVCFNIPADSPLRLYLIPQAEMETNDLIGANNPEGPNPTPIN